MQIFFREAPHHSAVNLGLKFWPVLYLFYGILSIRLFPQYEESLFWIFSTAWFANTLGLYLLLRGRKAGYPLYFWSALPGLPLSFLAVYSLYKMARGRRHSRIYEENLVQGLLAGLGLAIIVIFLMIVGFILFRGLLSVPLGSQSIRDWNFFFAHIPLKDFIFSHIWTPTSSPPSYGIAGFIWGSFQITLLALLIAVPIGLSSAVFIAEFAPPRLTRLFRGSFEVLAGIPSVVFGFFGVKLIVPFIRELIPSAVNNGYNSLSAAIILAFMIVPTIINISEVSIRSVSQSFRAGSLALGATQWQTISSIVIPSAAPGICTSIVLGTCRAIGETLAVLMLAGNAVQLTFSPLKPIRTLTMNIVSEMSYAQDDLAGNSFHLTALFTTSIVLIIFILGLNILLNWVRKRIQRYLNPV